MASKALVQIVQCASANPNMTRLATYMVSRGILKGVKGASVNPNMTYQTIRTLHSNRKQLVSRDSNALAKNKENGLVLRNGNTLLDKEKAEEKPTFSVLDEVLLKKYDEVYSMLNNNDQNARCSKLRKAIGEYHSQNGDPFQGPDEIEEYYNLNGTPFQVPDETRVTREGRIWQHVSKLGRTSSTKVFTISFLVFALLFLKKR
jgi:hypothetical protein